MSADWQQQAILEERRWNEEELAAMDAMCGSDEYDWYCCFCGNGVPEQNSPCCGETQSESLEASRKSWGEEET